MGHDFATNPSEPKMSRKAPGKFVHIKESWYQVTRTCRQIYDESRPIFFASRSYYLANHQDLARFLDYSKLTRLSFRCDTITALCVRDLVKNTRVYAQEDIDEIFSDPTTLERSSELVRTMKRGPIKISTSASPIILGASKVSEQSACASELAKRWSTLILCMA